MFLGAGLQLFLIVLIIFLILQTQQKVLFFEFERHTGHYISRDNTCYISKHKYKCFHKSERSKKKKTLFRARFVSEEDTLTIKGRIIGFALIFCLHSKIKRGTCEKTMVNFKVILCNVFIIKISIW